MILLNLLSNFLFHIANPIFYEFNNIPIKYEVFLLEILAEPHLK